MLFAPILHTYFMCHGAHVPSIFLFLRCGPNVRNSVIKPQKHSSSIRARVVSNVAELSYLNIVPRDDPDIRRYRRSPSARLVVAPTWYESSLHVRLRELKDQGRPVRGTGGDDPHPSVGFNFKLTNLHSAVGLGQLEYLSERLARQKRTYLQYERSLAEVNGIRLPGFDIDGGESPQWVDAIVEHRDELDRFLQDRRMYCRPFWFPLHTQPPYRLSDEGFPGSVWAAPRALWLPSAFTMSDTDVDSVISAIHEFTDSKNEA